MTLMNLRLAFNVAMLGFFTFAYFYATGFRALAKTFPMTAAAAGIVATTLLIVRDVVGAIKVRRDENQVLLDEDETATLVQGAHEGSMAPIFLGAAKQAGWILGFLLILYLVGLPLGSFVFVFVFLRFESGMTTKQALLSASLTLLAIFVLVTFMNLGLPNSIFDPLGAVIG